MATIASRAPEMGLGMAVKGAEYFGASPPTKVEQFLRKALKVDPTKPETIAEALQVGAHPGVTASHMTEVSTRNNLIGSAEIDPDTGVKTRTSSEEIAHFQSAEEGKKRVETLRNYHTLPPTDKAKQELQDRVVSVVRARPEGNTVFKGKNSKDLRAEADQFIKDHFTRLSTGTDEDIQRILEDQTQNPITTSEAVLQAKLQQDEAAFTFQTADEALTDMTTHHGKLKAELADFTTIPPGTQGARLEALEGAKNPRLAAIAHTEAAIRAMDEQRSADIKSLSDLRSRYGTKARMQDERGVYYVSSDPEIHAEILRLEGVLKTYDDPSTGLPKLYEDLTTNQIAQKEYETLLKRKSNLPAEIAKAREDILTLTKEKTTAREKLKKAKEAAYYANQARATTELKYADSVDHIFDNAVNQIIDDNIDAVVPHLAKGLDMEAQLRVTEMEERVNRQYKKKSRKITFLGKTIKREKITWDKKLIRSDMEHVATWNDSDFDTFILGGGTPLVDHYTSLDPSEKAHMRALVATHIVDTNWKINHKIPNEGQLFDLAQKGWVDSLHVLNLKNNPAYVAQLEQQFPGEEINGDNLVLTAKVRKNIISDGSLMLLMFGLSAVNTASQEKKG
jgi:hypothetical protein